MSARQDGPSTFHVPGGNGRMRHANVTLPPEAHDIVLENSAGVMGLVQTIVNSLAPQAKDHPKGKVYGLWYLIGALTIAASILTEYARDAENESVTPS